MKTSRALSFVVVATVYLVSYGCSCSKEDLVHEHGVNLKVIQNMEPVELRQAGTTRYYEYNLPISMTQAEAVLDSELISWHKKKAKDLVQWRQERSGDYEYRSVYLTKGHVALRSDRSESSSLQLSHVTIITKK